MTRRTFPRTLARLSVLLAVAAGAVGESLAQGPAVPPNSKREARVELKIPESLRLRHEAFRAEFAKALKDHGKVGQEAKVIEKLASAHFAKAKDVFPALGLLPLLAEGKVTPEMAAVRRITNHLRAALPQIRQEHRELVAGLKKIAEAARQEGKIEYVHFVERLNLHIQEEEEVLYPTVLLVGELVQLKLAHE